MAKRRLDDEDEEDSSLALQLEDNKKELVAAKKLIAEMRDAIQRTAVVQAVDRADALRAICLEVLEAPIVQSRDDDGRTSLLSARLVERLRTAVTEPTTPSRPG